MNVQTGYRPCSTILRARFCVQDESWITPLLRGGLPMSTDALSDVLSAVQLSGSVFRAPGKFANCRRGLMEYRQLNPKTTVTQLWARETHLSD